MSLPPPPLPEKEEAEVAQVVPKLAPKTRAAGYQPRDSLFAPPSRTSPPPKPEEEEEEEERNWGKAFVSFCCRSSFSFVVLGSYRIRFS